MTRSRAMFSIALLFVASACSRAGEAWSYNTRVGVANISQTPCLAMPTPVKAGDAVTIVDPERQQASRATVGSARAACNPAQDASWSSQTLQLDSAPQVPAIGIALSNVKTKLERQAQGLTGDLDGDGSPEWFRSCTSAEGVHLTIWSGAPLTGTRRWHHYYYLGYDTTPSCTTAEVGERIP